MRLRTLLLAFLITFTFVWLTSRASWDLRNLAAPMLRGALNWSGPETVRGAGLTPDEQNNIDIYKAARLATVYITSTAVR